MKINFLGACRPAVALTKTITPTSKEAYPLVKYFTSTTEEVATPLELFNVITKHAALGHCMLKGAIARPLVDEERRGMTKTDDPTSFVCLDFDRHITDDLDEDLAKLGLGNVSYVLQYSSSQGLAANTGTVSAHVFMLLDKPLPAPLLKAWLMHLNLTHFLDVLDLSRSKCTIRWPLDITTCQNDKLLYIAPPIFRDMQDPLERRIELVKKKRDTIDTSTIGERHINALKEDARKALNKLRKDEGLPTRTAKTSWMGPIEVENKPDICTVTGIREQNEFVRLNLNGGDSWAYWHPKDNFEIIHDFKSDTNYRTKELVPGYYQELVQKAQQLNATPTEDGDLILAFRDFASAQYYNGLWNPQEEKLTLNPARNETQLDHWMKSHGRTLGDFIPVWEILYNPREDWICDVDGHRINTFAKTKYMKTTPSSTAQFPYIKSIVLHMLGCEDESDPVFDHFINWFACIMQRQHKPRTAWVLQGTEGTGKGYFFHDIAVPLIGKQSSTQVLINTMEDAFNGWISDKLLIMVNEVDVEDFKDKGRISAKLKDHITDPIIPIRNMYQKSREMPNYASFIFASNKPQPVFIPREDRRYNVGNYQTRKLPYPDNDRKNAELEAFAQWLLAYQIDTTKADTVLQTEARTNIQNRSTSSVDSTLKTITIGDFETLWLFRPNEELLMRSQINNNQTQIAQAYCMLVNELARDIIKGIKAQKLTREELFIIMQYNIGGLQDAPNKFTALLRHHGVITRRIRKNDVLTYGIDVTWEVSDELRSELLRALKSKGGKLIKIEGNKTAAKTAGAKP